MTPEQKAILLLNKMYNANHGFINELEGGFNHAKECALICVEQILHNSSLKLSDTFIAFWHQVKQEINKL